eukprot:COSAG05_NODE_535_length_8871_cov_311.345759_4_plen_244_part_00
MHMVARAASLPVAAATVAPRGADGHWDDGPAISAKFYQHGFVVLPAVFSDDDLSPVTEYITGAVDSVLQKLSLSSGKPLRPWTSVAVAQQADDELTCRLPALASEFDVTSLDILHDVQPFKHHAAARPLAPLQMHHNLVTHPKLLHAVRAILGPSVMYSYAGICRAKLPADTNTPSRSTVPTTLHQDSQYFDSVDQTFQNGEVCPGLPQSTANTQIVSVWVPLVDTTGDLGTLELIPGTLRGL